MPRQQRAPINRRPWRPTTPPRTAILAPEISLIAGAMLTLQFKGLNAPPTPTTTLFPVLMPGLPKVLRVATGQLCNGALRDNDGLHLNLLFPPPDLTPADVFYLGPYDPAIRTATGGFSAPAILAQQSTPLSSHNWGANGTALNSLVINLGNPGTTYYLNPWSFSDLTTGAQVLSVASWTASTLILAMDAATYAGDQIQYNPAILTVAAGSGDQLDAVVVTAT